MAWTLYMAHNTLNLLNSTLCDDAYDGVLVAHGACQINDSQKLQIFHFLSLNIQHL